MEIFENVRRAIRLVMEKARIPAASLAALSIANQRETSVAWDKITGLPVCNAVVWQCSRSEPVCAALSDRRDFIRSRTGLELSPFFSAGKFKWIAQNAPNAPELIKQKRLLFGTMDSWLIWKLSGGWRHLTDYTNASRTQLFNIHSLSWDGDMLELFQIPHEALPEVRFSDEHFGAAVVDGCEVPITGVMGDSHAAFFAQNCFAAGEAKATYGTGSSVMMNIGGGEPILSGNGLVTSVGYGVKQKLDYVLEGNINATGATVKWLSEKMGVAPVHEFEGLAKKAGGNLGVCVVPAFTGLGAPHWDSGARACITGLSFQAGREHIARAGLESIAFQIADVADAMAKDSGRPIRRLLVDGGPTANGFLMQFQSDILPAEIATNRTSALSAAGGMLAAGLAAGFWRSLEDIRRLRRDGRVYASRMGDAERAALRAQWGDAVAMVCCRRGGAGAQGMGAAAGGMGAGTQGMGAAVVGMGS